MNKSHSIFLRVCVGLLVLDWSAGVQAAAPKPRARDLGVPFTGKPGPWNAITDVPGVEVGEVTLISGAGKHQRGIGPVRTGVTAILPRGKLAPTDAVFAGWFTLNGNGEMTGTTWVDESGLMFGPVMITNTESVGVVRDAVIAWSLERYRVDLSDTWQLPVVAETSDDWLNDMDGFHVKAEHAFAALDTAKSGPVAEGNVGGGTGMICYEFKGGTGTASRTVADELRAVRGRRAGAVEFWPARTADHRRSAGRPGNLLRQGLRGAHAAAPWQGRGLDHRRAGDQRAAPAPSAQAHRAARGHGHRAHRRHRRATARVRSSSPFPRPTPAPVRLPACPRSR